MCFYTSEAWQLCQHFSSRSHRFSSLDSRQGWASWHGMSFSASNSRILQGFLETRAALLGPSISAKGTRTQLCVWLSLSPVGHFKTQIHSPYCLLLFCSWALSLKTLLFLFLVVNTLPSLSCSTDTFSPGSPLFYFPNKLRILLITLRIVGDDKISNTDKW